MDLRAEPLGEVGDQVSAQHARGEGRGVDVDLRGGGGRQGEAPGVLGIRGNPPTLWLLHQPDSRMPCPTP